MARPRITVDVKLVEDLARLHVPKTEIAAIVGCSVDTLDRRYAAIIDKGNAAGRTKLRRLQMEAAERGNVTMLIWLGKQMLGQSDRPSSDSIFHDIDMNKLTDDQLGRIADGEDVHRVLKGVDLQTLKKDRK